MLFSTCLSWKKKLGISIVSIFCPRTNYMLSKRIQSHKAITYKYREGLVAEQKVYNPTELKCKQTQNRLHFPVLCNGRLQYPSSMERSISVRVGITETCCISLHFNTMGLQSFRFEWPMLRSCIKVRTYLSDFSALFWNPFQIRNVYRIANSVLV